MTNKLLILTLLIGVCSYIGSTNPFTSNNDFHHNYYLAAMAYNGGWPMKDRQSDCDQHKHVIKRKDGDRPTIIVEHIHKQEIDEDRYRIVPQPQPYHQQHQQQQHEIKRREDFKPTYIVEHVHKEEIDEDRYRIVPQAQPHHQQQHHPMDNQYGGGFPYYLMQYRQNRPRQNQNEISNPRQNTGHNIGFYYGQGYGGYNWKAFYPQH